MSFEFLSGQVVNGKYLLCEPLGNGSNGTVFRAEKVLATLTGNPTSICRETDYAVKILSRSEDDPDRFLPELQLAATLNHPHILRGYEGGATTLYKGAFLFLAMEKAEASLLTRLAPDKKSNNAQAPLSPDETTELALCLVSALAYTHSLPHPVVHFDIKPSNVMWVRERDGRAVWKLGDFGIARVLLGNGALLTATSAGSHPYKPPERFGLSAESPVDTVYDMWTLGVTLLEALGEIPIGGGEQIALQLLLGQNYTPPEYISDPLRQVIAGCLVKDWRERMTAQEALNLLSPFAENAALYRKPIEVIAEPSARPLTPFSSGSVNPKDGAALIFIPAGAFLMGADKHEVNMPEYTIYQTPVTVAMYRQFVAEAGIQFDWDKHQPSYGWPADHPMVNVTWEEASAYCQWAGGALPTEAEWEKAARGMDGREFPWGMEWEASRCNNYGAGPKQTTPVFNYLEGASPYGVLDMAGNVWEWCEDRVDEKYRALRGGSWGSGNPNDFRSAYQYGNVPTLRIPYIGFRCVLR